MKNLKHSVTSKLTYTYSTDVFFSLVHIATLIFFDKVTHSESSVIPHACSGLNLTTLTFPAEGFILQTLNSPAHCGEYTLISSCCKTHYPVGISHFAVHYPCIFMPFFSTLNSTLSSLSLAHITRCKYPRLFFNCLHSFLTLGHRYPLV